MEDNEVNQKLVVSLLEQEGHEVDVAQDGAEAVKKVTHGDNPYDLILMDMQMPVMDGLEATRRIRAHERATREHVRIVAMTANALPEDRDRCLAAGMDEYLSKPIRVDELRAALRWQDAGYSPTVPGLLDVSVPQSASPSSQAPVGFDYRQAVQNADRMVVRIIADSFRSNWPLQVRDMRQAMAENDAKLLQRSAHSLRGLLGNFGADPAEALSRKIEVIGAKGVTTEAAPLLQQLELDLQRLDEALADFMNRSG